MPPVRQSRRPAPRSSARPAAAARRAGRGSARRPAARRPAARRPAARFKWERLARVSLLLVLGVVVALYVQHARAYLASRAQAQRQQQILAALTREHARLERLERSLSQPGTIVAAARRLGMVRPGEVPYSVIGSAGR